MGIARTLTGIAAIAGMSAPAMASDWWLLDIAGQRPARRVIFMDKSSIRPVGSKVRAWKSTYFETKEAGARYDKVLVEYDCVNQTSGMVSYIDYDANGAPTASSSAAATYPNHKPIAPDTVGEVLLKFACGSTTGAVQIGAISDLAISGSAALKVWDERKD